jgi:hypothetical protein
MLGGGDRVRRFDDIKLIVKFIATLKLRRGLDHTG